MDLLRCFVNSEALASIKSSAAAGDPALPREPGFALFFPRFPPLRRYSSFGKLRRVMINHAVIIEAMDPANIPLARSYSM